MSSIKNIALIGASGSVGTASIAALLKSGEFNITVLTRPESTATFPSGVKIVSVDYDDVPGLTKAFQGIDAVISVVAFRALEVQFGAIDAALAAGVKRFLPSEFGYDLGNAKSFELFEGKPVFGVKNKVRRYLEEKAAANPDFSYTYVMTGGFIDWGLEKNFLLDLASGKPTLFDGGDRPFTITTLESTGNAVLGIMRHPEETKNRDVYFQDALTTQNKILALAKKVAPEKTASWEPVHMTTVAAKEASDAKLAAGDTSLPVLFPYLFVSFFAEGYGGEYKNLDNELLGIPGDLKDSDIEAILIPLLK